MFQTVSLAWIFAILCSLGESSSTTFVVDTSGRGLVKNDILEWSARTNLARIPSFLYIRAPASNRRMYPLMKLELQGARNRIIVQSGLARPSPPSIMLCALGEEVIAPGKPFKMHILVRSEDFQIFINGYLKYTLKLAHDAPLIDKVTKLAVYNSDGAVRILNDTTYSELLSAPNCGFNINSIKPPPFCGSTGPVSERIVGGVESRPGSHPWQVSIRTKPVFTIGQPHICGGTLISNCLVVTAGHCFYSLKEYPLSKMIVRVGDYYNRDGTPHSRDPTVENSEDIEIESVIRHERYDLFPTPTNDIAVIKLRTCVTFDKFKRPACLPTGRNQFRPGTDCGISGWGALNSTDYPTEYPACLQGAIIEIKTDRQCKTAFQEKYLLKKMMCANTDTADTCQGDSGGPMTCHNEDNRHFLWGVTSWGEGCGDAKKPGVYTRVTTYLRWLFMAINLSPQPQRFQKDVKNGSKPKYCHNYVPADF
uniref:Plasma kallikrein n=1 Tax=Phallusia mammillata TaxID=59560 RepID=A0A6F9DD30_9ASCI|nr:plasma kallikrein [Phallusia mammillata]